MDCRIYNLPDHRQIQILGSSADEMNPDEPEYHLPLIDDSILDWEVGFQIHNCIECGFPNLIAQVTIYQKDIGETVNCAEQKCSFCQEKLTENGEIIRDEIREWVDKDRTEQEKKM